MSAGSREPTHVAIVGAGKVAHLHAGALRMLPEARLVAVCGRDPRKADDFAAQHGARAFTDVARMVREAAVRVVIIATPHPQHATPAVAAARAGAHVLVEKPLAATLADCDAILAAVRAGGVQAGVICQRRFYAPCQRIRRALDTGKLGRPVLGTVTMFGWRDEAYYRSDPWRGSWRGEGGGVLVNQAPHQLDLLQWYLGEIDELYGQWANFNHPYLEVEDTAVATIRFKSGALGTILVSNAQNPALYGRVTVHGSNGASVGVQTDGGAMFIAGRTTITEPPVNDLWTVPGEQRLLALWQREDAEFFQRINPLEYYHARQFADFLAAVRTGGRPLVTLEDGRRTVELFTAIYRAQRDRAPVRFPLVAEPA